MLEFGAIGLGICYDLRFSEYVHYLCNQRLDVTHIINNANDSCPLGLDLTDLGPFMLVFPGAFNWTTGPLHWELLLRARAVDNQVSGLHYQQFLSIHAVGVCGCRLYRP